MIPVPKDFDPPPKLIPGLATPESMALAVALDCHAERRQPHRLLRKHLDALLARYGLAPRKTFNRPEYGPTPTTTLCRHGANLMLKLQAAKTPAQARRLVRAAECNVCAILVPNRSGEWR